MIDIIITLIAVCAAAAGAPEGAVERDPFHPVMEGAVATAPTQTPIPITMPTATPATAPATTNNSWGRDPFSNPLADKAPAPAGSAPGAPGIVLTGIIFGADVRLAIIGGELYGEGSVVADKKLVVIRNRSVVFEGAEGGQEEVFLENFTFGK